MDYLKVSAIAALWGLSERSVRNYCANNRIPGAKMIGKTWMIPSDAKKPEKKENINFLNVLKLEKENQIKGGIYHKVQVELTYNSNHMEGSRLSYDQTRFIFETNTIGFSNESINIDDIIETINHFKCIDYIIDNVNTNISVNLIKELHRILKNNTSDSNKKWFAVGEYKKIPNEVGGRNTTDPEDVSKEIKELLKWYYNKFKITFNDVVEFHLRFENIHPFQDGNGRVGRLLMFKECLKHKIVPFIITDDIKMFYYRGLKEWEYDKAFLIDTCLSAQDKFKKYLDYFKINY